MESIIKATVVSHNFLIQAEQTKAKKQQNSPADFGDTLVDDGSFINGAWRDDMQSDSTLLRIRRFCGTNNAALIPLRVRAVLRDYFVSEYGAVPWQDRRVYGLKETNT